MKTVYKYHLSHPFATIAIPQPAQILSAGLQDDQIVIWALIDPRPPARARQMEFLAVNTGAPMPEEYILEDFRFLNTVTTSNGVVWHVFCERTH